jgi:DNA repair ATPase RecN
MAIDDMNNLIETFKAYRELLVPMQSNLNDFIETYDQMQTNIEKLNAAFSGDIKQNLEGIYKNLSVQAAKASDLASQIDKFSDITNKYISEVTKLTALFEKTEQRITAVNRLEEKATEQIARLDALIEEKTKTYNIKDLQRTLDAYDANVQKVSEFINKDIAETMYDGKQKLDGIKESLSEIYKTQDAEKVSLEKLLQQFSSSSELLKTITEKQDVNEAYIFEIIDRWAETRRVKAKK